MTQVKDGMCWDCGYPLRAGEYGRCMPCEDRMNRRMLEKEMRLRKEDLYREAKYMDEWQPRPTMFNTVEDMLHNANFSNATVVRDCFKLMILRIEELEAQLRDFEATKEVVPRLQQMVQDLQ